MSAHSWDSKFDRVVSAPLRRGYPEPIGEAAYHGLAGDVVRTILPDTEADPVALLVQFLVAYGSCVGRGPHYLVEGDEHHANLFATVVGDTAKARKGVSWSRIRQLFVLLDDCWVRECVSTGLSSGEGLIWAVRDSQSEADSGITDKRLMVLESEFANILRMVQRDGNTLSRVVRDAWDRDSLATLTKNSPVRATGTHISIVGHITEEELKRELTRTEIANGFANRFLFVCVKRSKLLPHGRSLDPAELKQLAKRLATALTRARALGRLTMTSAASAAWSAVYQALSEAGTGLVEHVTARGEAQVIRLATLYALLDATPQIDQQHLRAAIAVWEYAEASAEYIFGMGTGNPTADRIVAALTDHSEMTRTEINKLFGGHRSKDRIDAARELLATKGLIIVENRDTQGRSSEVWSLVS